MRLFNRVRAIYRLYKGRAFLTKHNCESWRQYAKKYDPDCNKRATKLSHIYHGYQYIYCFENGFHEIYDWGIEKDGRKIVDDWCFEHLKGKFRLDGHRVIRYNDHWHINEIGGGDYIFAAFQNEQDYLMFLLRWS